jgi:MPBQ/MSBQ methyltransferase
MPIPFLFVAILILVFVVAAYLLRASLRAPSHRYEGRDSVSEVYDRWTKGRVTEYYWGEHLHAGYYGNPPVKKDFVQAKVDFIDEMIAWGVTGPNPTLMRRLETPQPGPGFERVRMLDVGCGIGGSVRHVAKRWPQTAHVTGITISKAQVSRAEALTRSQGVENTIVMECDALNMSYADNSFDVVWAIESEMHMPDKDKFIREMVRVLRSPDPASGKSGGMLVIACWNVRDTRNAPLSRDEAAHIRLLVDEWCHAEFTSIHDYLEIFNKNGLTSVSAEDWAVPTQPSWRDAVMVATRNPRGMMNVSMQQRWSLVRDAYTTLRYDEAFRKGLCEYGMIRGQKAA